MGIGLIDLSTDGKLLSISDYEKAYDAGIAYDEVTTISTSLIRNIPNGFISNFKSLKELNLPDVRELKSNAFESCSIIEKVTLKNVSLLSNASIFKNCSNLKQVIFANNVEITSNAQSIFHGCRSLQSITDMVCNDYIPQYAFNGCHNLKTIGISGSYSAISGNAFEYCMSLANIYIGSNVEFISWSAFAYCYELQNVNGQFSNLSNIGSRAFYSCSKLKNVNEIIKYASSIGDYAFHGCKSLYSLSISGSPHIGSHAFQECDNISYINASEITVLRGLPYTTSHNFGSVSTIYEIFSNNHFSGVLDLSTVETVYPRAGLSIFSKIYLENCTSYAFDSYNIRGDKIEEFVCPYITSFGSTILPEYFGFVGSVYQGSNSDYVSYYGSVILSKLFIDNTYEFFSYDFPSISSNGFPTNKCLYSCIEELSIPEFGYFLNNYNYSISDNVKYPLINNFDNLKTIHTQWFSIQTSYTNLSTIENMYMHNNRFNTATPQLNTSKFSNITFSSNINIYFTDNYYSYAIFSFINNNSIDCNLYFKNISNLDFYMSGSNITLNTLEFNNISRANFYIDVGFASNLHTINFNNLYSGYIAIKDKLTNLKNVVANNFISGDTYIYGKSENYISMISLPSISYGKVIFQYINDVYLGCTKISADYFLSSGGVYISALNNINNLYLNNCSIIHVEYSKFKPINLYAPLCNELFIGYRLGLSDSPLKSITLSEYVDRIHIPHQTQLSYISIKTSGDYTFTDSPFEGCTSIKNFYMSASNISAAIVDGLFGRGYSMSMQNVILNAMNSINIRITAIPKQMLSISCNDLSFSYGGHLYNYTYIKADTITNLHSNKCYGNCLIELDTSAFLSNLNQLYSSGITENIIIKVRESLLESYNSAYSSYSEYLNFIAI